ncbi:hypothetical protein J7373_08795 [Xanthomonas sp. A2111]|uniref:NTF2 fold domain-containing protein n=1 Tax=Xanthomonas hawaiiensis TaxID=3003247 RepID=A0ABU2I4M3_9XANT|nr:hypothetical protein [Xanthomonas sp. A2111]MBO9828340.1 hypothetical protein [Xanthomonas sp. A2111]MDS9993088.1 hypothetical protein [Xanthomonas sp. A2111]
MKILAILLVVIMTGGCAMQQKTTMPMSLSMMLMNQGHPFISKALAERIALAVINDKYPNDIFATNSPGLVVDKGEVWLVTFSNALISQADQSPLPMLNGQIVPKKLTVTIRKKNGEIIDVS